MSETSNKDKIVIRIVDDDADLRNALEFLLLAQGWEVRLFASALDFLSMDIHSDPGCLVLDVRMPEMSGIELQAEMNRRAITLPIIFLTGHGDMKMAVDAMKNGAADFIAKPIDPQQFVQAIQRALLQGQIHQLGLGNDAQLRSKWAQLTAREKEVCLYLGRGFLNREVASRLCISERTVEGHRSASFKKLGIKTVQELILIYIRLQK